MSVDGINATEPVDRVAYRVTRWKGCEWVPNKQIRTRDSATPLPTQAIPRGQVDLRGLTFGRMVVVGYDRPARGNDKGASWVVRCACGTYTTRRTKSITNPANYGDCCETCRQLQHIQRNEHWRRTGRDGE